MGVEAIATAILRGDALAARSLTHDWLAGMPQVAAEPAPTSRDARVRAVAASLIELFAERISQTAPAWSGGVGPVEEPIYLLAAARTMPRLRRMCEDESPAPLRRRRLLAPRDLLTFA